MFGQFVCGLLASSLPLFCGEMKQNLFVSHYDGHVFSLTVDPKAESLTLTDTVQACGGMPSWLTLDPATRTLYCSDETGTSANVGNGSLSSFAVSSDGSLKELAKVTTLPGGVASVIYEGLPGKQYLAIAHYEGSAISTFALPITAESTALQTFEYTLPGPGTVPGHQEAPHPHEVFLDPTGSFVLSPDLGSDVVRVFAIEKASGKLNLCLSYAVTPGNGPRHGAFWTPEDDSASPVLYIDNELANTVDAYNVSYGPCLSLHPTQVVVPYPHTLPSTDAVAEIRTAGDRDVYVSIRYDQAFAPNDSMALLHAADKDGSLTFSGLTSSYGKTPRTFVINKAGNLVAIGNQASSNVAIVQRDQKTGVLGELVASLQVGTPGTVGGSNGLSSVIWDE